MEMLKNQLIAMQAAFDADKANTASALAKLKSEMVTATAERFNVPQKASREILLKFRHAEQLVPPRNLGRAAGS